MTADSGALASWARSGAMYLTGRPERPLGPPAALCDGLARLGRDLGSLIDAAGGERAVDPFQAVVDRAAIAGFERQGDLSCGGRTRLLRCRDGWIAASLARETDVGSVPAWLEIDDACASVLPQLFDEIAGRVAGLSGDELVASARLLGLPVAALGSVTAPGKTWGDAVTETAFRGPRNSAATERPLVVDLSALWAGPLCSSVLQSVGARVIKVESERRPDGARRGPQGVFDLLNGGKESLTLDFGCDTDMELLRRLLLAADIVVEASRPRALEQLDIFANEIGAAAPTVWVAITGYGRIDPQRDWVAFGDDAAVAGGLVVWGRDGPGFCADAIADPLTGMVAAAAALKALQKGNSALLDVAMARVSAVFAGPTLVLPDDLEPHQPLATTPTRRGPQFGADSEAIRREFAE